MSFEIELLNALNEAVDEKKEQAQKIFGEVAKSTVKDLKNTSPKRTGDYAKTWAIKKQNMFNGDVYLIVHNTKHYQLTHLLENGHVIKNGRGTYGRVRAIKHIKPAEDRAEQMLLNELEQL